MRKGCNLSTFNQLDIEYFKDTISLCSFGIHQAPLATALMLNRAPLCVKGDILCIFDFFCIHSCGCKRSWKLKRSKSAPNRSSPLLQKIPLWKHLVSSHAFNYVTLWHRATSPSHTFAWFWDSLAHKFKYKSLSLSLSLSKSWFSTAALLLLAVLGQASVRWPIRADWVFRGVGLKETGAKTDSVSDGTQCCNSGCGGFLQLNHVHLL